MLDFWSTDCFPLRGKATTASHDCAGRAAAAPQLRQHQRKSGPNDFDRPGSSRIFTCSRWILKKNKKKAGRKALCQFLLLRVSSLLNFRLTAANFLPNKAPLGGVKETAALIFIKRYLSISETKSWFFKYILAFLTFNQQIPTLQTRLSIEYKWWDVSQ